jgi:uncharacterized protein
MSVKVIKGRGAIPGVAEGIAMVSRETIQGWSGLDDKTGLVIEKGHPFEGMSIKGSVLILSGGKGSNGWSCHFHAARVRGIGPAAFVFPRIDSRTGVAAVVTGVPTITDLEEDPFDVIRTGDLVRVDGNRGTVEIIQRINSETQRK